MIGILVFLIIVFLLATGFSWLADQPGNLLILKLGNFQFAEENLAVIAAMVLAILLAIVFIWILVTLVWKTPGNIGSFFKNRRREKGWRALADGMIAIGSGDVRTARRAARNTIKYLPEEPVTRLLSAQAAQLDGKPEQARQAFARLLETPETQLLGLRGLYIEAQAAGETEAARQFVEQAALARPGLDWSGKALLSMQANEGNWEGALVTLHQNADARLYDKSEAKRLRAVLLTAHAKEIEVSNPQKAREKALEAHRLAPELVPAAVISGRVLARLGELRKAAKTLETTWRLLPHPELMAAYTHLRPGDSGLDRLKRAETLNSLRANHPEGAMGVARARIAIENWAGARAALDTLAKANPSERICLLMAEIEEGEFGDRGRVREWLGRAVRAPRDPAWTADGYIADEWAPVSPVSGQIDAFEWRIPLENLNKLQQPVLDDIPQGPREPGPPAPFTNEDIKLSASTRPALPNSPQPIEEAVAPIAQSTATPEPVQDQQTGTARPVNQALTKENQNQMPLDPAPEPVQMDDFDDPITHGPIDDPGIKLKQDEGSKRFKLF